MKPHGCVLRQSGKTAACQVDILMRTWGPQVSRPALTGGGGPTPIDAVFHCGAPVPAGRVQETTWLVEWPGLCHLRGGKIVFPLEKS